MIRGAPALSPAELEEWASNGSLEGEEYWKISSAEAFAEGSTSVIVGEAERVVLACAAGDFPSVLQETAWAESISRSWVIVVSIPLEHVELLGIFVHDGPLHSLWGGAVSVDGDKRIQAVVSSGDVEPVTSVLGVAWATVLSPHVVAGSAWNGLWDLLTVPCADKASS